MTITTSIFLSVLSMLIASISLYISYLSYKSDQYKINISNSDAIGIMYQSNWSFITGISTNVGIHNSGKRPVTIQSIDLKITWWALLKMYMPDDLYIKSKTLLPCRLNENESIKFDYDVSSVVEFLDVKKMELKKLVIGTQDWKTHEFKIKHKILVNKLNKYEIKNHWLS